MKIDIPPVISVPLLDLEDAPINPNKMSKADFEALKRGVTEYGMLQPLLVRESERSDKYEIVDGHHRRNAVWEVEEEAGTDLGTVELPSMDVTGKTTAEIRAISLMMGRLRGRPDLAKVGDIFEELQVDFGWDVDAMTISGYSEAEAQALLERDDEDIGMGDLAGGAVPSDGDDSDRESKIFELTIAFATADELKQAKRVLRKAAGRGSNDLARGFRNLAGMEE